MIISKTPYRISLVGGGTDLPEFFENHEDGGAVISFPINKYIYICINNLFEGNGYFLKYSNIERINSIDDIEHNIIRAVFNKYGVKKVDFSSIGDIPSGTGMGSSSAFTVGLLNSVREYIGKEEKSQSELAKEACEIEVDLLKAPIGFQDQYGSALGGIKKISFYKRREIKIENIQLETSLMNRLNQNTILFYIGDKRSASKILKKQAEDTLNREETKKSLIEMKNLADQLADEIITDVDSVGDYLHQNWILKRKLTTGITSNKIDEIYKIGKENGALGGKLLGAGAGGSMMFYCPIEKQKSLIKSLNKLKYIDFKIDEAGTSIVRI
mgnify:CR=1 FL=1|tara:strand:+ start:9168 stop:10148 length:981 start_codon:yes stop_codon:yes gene_type:complete